jgi:CRISPR-associated protein Csx17
MAFRWRLAAPVADVGAFVSGALDDGHLGRLLSALLLLDWTRPVDTSRWFEGTRPGLGSRTPAWEVLAPFFHGRPIEVRDETTVDLLPQASWPPRLAQGRVQPVIEEALRRLRIACLAPAPANPGAIARSAPSGRRLAAALLCPLSNGAVATLLRRVVPDPLD